MCSSDRGEILQELIIGPYPASLKFWVRSNELQFFQEKLC